MFCFLVYYQMFSPEPSSVDWLHTIVLLPHRDTALQLCLPSCNAILILYKNLFVNPSWFWCHSGDCSILAGEQRQEEGSLSTWATLHQLSNNQFYWNIFINLVVWTIWCSDSDIATQENLPESSDLTSIMISDWLLLEYFKCSILMFRKIYLTCKVLCSWSFLHWYPKEILLHLYTISKNDMKVQHSNEVPLHIRYITFQMVLYCS